MKTLQKKNVFRPITRSMSLENGSENSLPIPIDVIILIFSRLNLKSIARCRCVSKLWASILRHSDFTELFLSSSCSNIPKILFAYHKNSEFVFFSSPQPQNPDENSSLVISDYQMKFSSDGNCEISDLVHGLICLTNFMFIKNKVESVLKICNPSTGQTLMLPKLKTKKKSRNWVWSLFGYDPIDKKFKVLSMTEPMTKPGFDVVCEEYQVLTLGSGKLSWKMLECCVPHCFPRKNICINGVLYYTSIDWLTSICIIVCFDVRFEKFSFIKTTEFIKRASAVQLINYNGKLGLLQCEEDVKFVIFDGKSITFKLWVLEDLEKQEWSNHNFLFPTVPENIVGRVILSFVGVTQTNEIVLSSSYPTHLFYLNLEKKTIVRVTIQGIEARENGRYYTFLNHVEDVKLYGSV